MSDDIEDNTNVAVPVLFDRIVGLYWTYS